MKRCRPTSPRVRYVCNMPKEKYGPIYSHGTPNDEKRRESGRYRHFSRPVPFCIAVVLYIRAGTRWCVFLESHGTFLYTWPKLNITSVMLNSTRDSTDTLPAAIYSIQTYGGFEAELVCFQISVDVGFYFRQNDYSI